MGAGGSSERLVVVEKIFRRRRRPPGGTPENLKIQVTKVSRYEVFGESGWRGSIPLVELVSSIKILVPKNSSADPK